MDHGIKPGDVVKRIWGNGFMITELRVCAVDEEFISCDAQRSEGDEVWLEIPAGSGPWRFDTIAGIETDEEQGWGLDFGICLSRIELPGVTIKSE